MSKFSTALAGLVLCVACAIPAQADPSDISGMAKLGPQSFVTVTDAKAKSEKPRFHVLTLDAKGVHYLPVSIDSWLPDATQDDKLTRSRDLEAICQVPGQPNTYFALESGYWKKSGGRAFVVRFEHHPLQGWQAIVEDIFQPLPQPASGETEDAQQIEGAAAVRDGEETTFLLLGLRGNKETPGQLILGQLDKDLKFKELARHEIDLRPFTNNGRSCSDLALQPVAPNKYLVLFAAANDHGDLGPFYSSICRVGTLEIKPQGVNLDLDAEPHEIYRLDGLKVEAICPSLPSDDQPQLFIGTDDESFAPVFRALPIAPEE